MTTIIIHLFIGLSQNLQNQEEAGQEAEAEQANPTMGKNEDRQHN